MSLATLKEKVGQLIEKAQSGGGGEVALWRSAIENDTYTNGISVFRGYKGTKVPYFGTLATKNTSHMFNSAINITSIDFYIDCPNSTNGSGMFYGTTAFKYLKGVNCSKMTNINQMCDRSGLEEIEMPLDISSVTNIGSAFACPLQEIRFISECIKVNCSFQWSPSLSAESKQSIFDGLATVTTAQTLTLNANAKILQSQVDSANAKGWTIAGGTVVSKEEYYG